VFSPTEFGNQKGLRIDRVLELQLNDSLEVLHNAGKTLKLENIYKYNQQSFNRFRQQSVVFRPKGRMELFTQNKDIAYNNCYRFDILKSRRLMRKTWVHISDTLPGFAQNEIQVAPGDRIEIAFCIYNLNGFVDMESLTWHKPYFAKLNDNMVDYTEYNRDIQL
jgi:hypothetical protein